MPCSLRELSFVSSITVSIEKFAVEHVLESVTCLYLDSAKTLDLGNDLFLPALKSLQFIAAHIASTSPYGGYLGCVIQNAKYFTGLPDV